METSKHTAAKKAYTAAVIAAQAKNSELTKARAWAPAKCAEIQAAYYALVAIQDAALKALTLARMENELEDAIAEGKVSAEQEAAARAYLVANA